jgi:hypothetical protein
MEWRNDAEDWELYQKGWTQTSIAEETGILYLTILIFTVGILIKCSQRFVMKPVYMIIFLSMMWIVRSLKIIVSI